MGRQAEDAMAASSPSSISGTIDAIGTPEFESQLFAFLHDASGADHCALYRSLDDGLQVVGAFSLDGTDIARRQAVLYQQEGFWRRDPVLRWARARRDSRNPLLMRLDPTRLQHRDFRESIYVSKHIYERLAICGTRPDGLYVLSLLRSTELGAFHDADVAALGASADLLVAALAKHESVTRFVAESAASALRSIDHIAERLARSDAGLTRREQDVCARILFGLSSAEIAAELFVTEESVATYRKRAYRRLNITGRYELLGWYLRL
jgi:DNA-binding CsgD family transcriptional regulator